MLSAFSTNATAWWMSFRISSIIEAMLSLFPRLLFLAPAAIALLRVVVGISVLMMAWGTWRARDDMTKASFPLFGHAPLWLVYADALLLATLGLALVLGLWTQAAALLATIGILDHLAGKRWQPELFPFATGTYALLFIMSLALVFTGAGAFAVDLPL